MASEVFIPGVLIKDGACVLGMTPQMVRGAITVGKAYAQFGPYVCVLTSGVDGVHGPTSLHYWGQAADFRTRNVPADRRAGLRDAVKAALGRGFDVVLESDHLHVEWDPKP